MNTSAKWAGHLAAGSAYMIFGFNIIVCKALTASPLISAQGLFTVRAFFAAAGFWLVSLFLPLERMTRRDLLQTALASFVGLYLPQITFLVAIGMTTPVDTSIVTATTPIFTMFIAAVVLKEPLTWKKMGGVALSFAGVILLILNTVHVSGSAVTVSRPLGIALMIANCFCFALYLGAFRPLIARYSVVTFMKWMFTFSLLMAAPASAKELLHLPYAELSAAYLRELAYLVVCATLMAYFLIPVGQKMLRPTVVSMYSYLQPLIASAMGIWLGMDTVSWQKVLAAAAVFTGVVLVNRSRAREMPAVDTGCAASRSDPVRKSGLQ